jgi:catechol 2,3-dioxygenase-like lactoylglutathione lyase family enzyme
MADVPAARTTEEAIMSVTMNHTGFVVNDLDASVEFYRDGLGLKVDQIGEGSSPALSLVVGYDNTRLRYAFLTGTDGHTLELIQYVNPAGTTREPEEQYTRSLSGATHLAFIVEDIDRVYQRLLAAGGRKLNPPADMRPGVRACYLQDPDGSWLELAEDAVHSRSPLLIRQNTAWSS